MAANSLRHGFLRNAIDAMIKARQRQADHYLNGVLLALDDETLAAHGLSRAVLRKRPSLAPYY